MKNQSSISEKLRSRLRLLQNPYAFIDFEQDDAGEEATAATLEQKRAYLRTLENPHAYHSIFSSADDERASATIDAHARELTKGDTSISKAEVEKLLDEVLNLYKDYVARDDWSKVLAYRPEFIAEASRTLSTMRRAAQRLQALKFELISQEKVEKNRAPAEKIVAGLKKLLS